MLLVTIFVTDIFFFLLQSVNTLIDLATVCNL